MCEELRHQTVDIPCSICVVADSECKDKGGSAIWGCAFGKPANDVLTWAFSYTNFLRSAGVPNKNRKSGDK